MPNRTDHTVNTTPPDPVLGVNSFVTVIGAGAAGLGALAVMLTGGAVGTWLGASILTILIILQVFALLSRSSASQELVSELPVEPAARVLSENDPVLILSVSHQGRIRAISGREAFLPGLKVGRVAEDVLGQNSDGDGLLSSEVVGPLSTIRVPSKSGELIIILPAVADQPAIADQENASEQVLERTQFFASLGHDLKSPLNGIIGFADIMDTELRGPMPEPYKDYPSLIRESGETLLRLVEDILGYAKAEAGTYELDVAPMDIAASGETVLRQSEAIAELSGIDLSMTNAGEVMAVADAGAVRRIWDNLVSNAIKYSSKADTVTLAAFEKAGVSYLRVRDTGAGMDAEDLARIAKPFAQGQNAKGRAGTGLGLAMVQRLAELQGGQVKIATAPGAGTTVTVSLPALSTSLKRAAE